MRSTTLAFVAGATLALCAGSAGAGDSDATQSFESPLPIGTGATFNASRDKSAVTVGLNQQVDWTVPFFLQAALSATADASGRATVVSGTEIQPGAKAKLGLGFSSAQFADVFTHGRRGGLLKQEVWCIDIAKAAARLVESFVSGGEGDTCAEAVRQLSQIKIPATAQGDKLKAALETLRKLSEQPQGATPLEDTEFIRRDRIYQEACSTEGALVKCIPGVEDLAADHPVAYARLLGPQLPPEVYWKVSVNWSPSLQHFGYRNDLGGGVFDLATPEDVNLWLNTISIDVPFYWSSFGGGMQLAYDETMDASPVEICRTVAQAEYSSRDCTNALLGKPSPTRAFRATVTAGFLPTLRPAAQDSLLVGGQLLLTARFSEGKDTYRAALPLYVTRNTAPLGDLVAGVQPTLDWVGGSGTGPTFSAVVFVGARP